MRHSTYGNCDNIWLHPTQSSDLNLLIVLDALLAAESVTGAARRLGLSAPAVSRALGRLRQATGDPLLVRAGRTLVPTPHAESLRDAVTAALREAQQVLARRGHTPPMGMNRTFTIRANEGLTGRWAAPLIQAAQREYPRICLRFIVEGGEDVETLRDGRTDLDVGVIGPLGPEIRVQGLFRDNFVGVVRSGHALAKGPVTPQRLVAYPHISASRRGKRAGPIDEALATLGLARTVALIVPTFHAALLAVAGSDLVAAIPSTIADGLLSALNLRSFRLPVKVDPVEIACAWHPRFHADPEHAWLRQLVRRICKPA